MERGDASGSVASVDTAQANKPKRVRTGCLTCRERHLKCDEALPNCQNCRKSSRICKRGIKLNFIDVTCRDPPVLLRSKEWEVTFQDNSREIASEYKGGLARYGISDAPHAPAMDPTMTYDFAPAPSHAPIHAPQPVPAIEGIGPDQYRDEPHQTSYSTRRDSYHHHTGSHSDSGYGSSYMPVTSSSSYANTEPPQTPAKEAKRLLTSRDEVLYIQIFVEEVGLWMDSMDPNKHVSSLDSRPKKRTDILKFSRILPFNSLGEPMLLNAFLACGARHLSLVNPKHSEDNALKYYDTAASLLLNAIPDPNRDTVICAITAVVLNVYEIMSEKALQRMNHIAGARALLKECHWDARSTGVGAACFWLNVGMELLSCLHFNWQVGWDPDSWGLNMDFTRDVEPAGEEVWTYRIMYVVAKIANFRAAATFKGKTQEGSPRSEDHQRQVRYAEWRDLKDLADRWNDSVPRSMQPLAYLDPSQTQSGSNFPEVYVIKRTSIVARLFYHTAMVLLAQVNPLGSNVYDDMRHMEAHHSNIICGIVAHTKDR